MAGEFAPGSRPDGPDCADRAAYGAASAIDQYITKQYLLAEEDYPKDACPNRYYSTAKIDNWQVTTAMTGALSTMNIPSCTISAAHVYASGSFSGPTISGLQAGINAAQSTASSKKGFDISHPTKENNRLRYICVEGPTADVYIRGRVTNNKEIILPTYWKELVDWTTITVNLTPIGSHQSVIVKRWDEEKIYLQSNGGMPIDCFYHVYGERIDVERNIPEYEGLTSADYPGDNSEYTLNNN